MPAHDFNGNSSHTPDDWLGLNIFKISANHIAIFYTLD
jgi:hypothetical protein